jgi:hypothetical protein
MIQETGMKTPTSISLAAVVALGGCGGSNTESGVTTPGGEESIKTRALEAGADLLQEKSPIRQFNAYLNGFHFYNGDLHNQMEAHHYCGHLDEEVIQCTIFDGNRADAKLMGVEYIISQSLFMQLPAEEKHLWHSHVHEVRSGQLIAPGIPQLAEHELMEKIAGTYGKTWHTWHTESQNRLPVGAPMLMMGFTADGQAEDTMIAKRDHRFDISSADKRAQRADIVYPAIDPDADAWQKGIVQQLELTTQPPR